MKQDPQLVFTFYDLKKFVFATGHSAKING